jgi:hypothetical protein
LLRLPAALRSTVASGAPHGFVPMTFREVANNRGRGGLHTLKAAERLPEAERLMVHEISLARVLAV